VLRRSIPARRAALHPSPKQWRKSNGKKDFALHRRAALTGSNYQVMFVVSAFRRSASKCATTLAYSFMRPEIRK
jgi:hypothetical protein